MDLGKFVFFLKKLQEEYALQEHELEKLKGRLMADEAEFERVSQLFHQNARGSVGGVDHFRDILIDLLR